MHAAFSAGIALTSSDSKEAVQKALERLEFTTQYSSKKIGPLRDRFFWLKRNPRSLSDSDREYG